MGQSRKPTNYLRITIALPHDEFHTIRDRAVLASHPFSVEVRALLAIALREVGYGP